jgi:hypothetical protein
MILPLKFNPSSVEAVFEPLPLVSAEATLVVDSTSSEGGDTGGDEVVMVIDAIVYSP